MSEIDDGGPAFPYEGKIVPGSPGMSLRDWFAGQALATFLTFEMNGGRAYTPSTQRMVAKAAYECADAMLSARKEKTR